MGTEVITIDGPTSSGKNSVGFLLAKKLRFQYIDTGMIYRAGCFKILKQNISLNDKEKILEVYRNLNVRFEMDGKWKMFLDEEDVTESLHDPEISELTSKASAIQKVRDIMKGIQREIAKNGKVVMGGRDIGSEIFPDANFKFFLTASVDVRVKRRFRQLLRKNPSMNKFSSSKIKYEDVLNDTLERDKRDAEREASPMRVPEDAVVIDNSNLTVEQTVEEMLKHIHAPN